MLYLVVSYLPALLCGIHVVRTGRESYWIWLLIIGGPLGAAIYFFAVMLPDLMGGRTARGLGQAARQALDPDREYRAARVALDETPTVGNKLRLANAAMAMGRANEAEPLYRESATGQWADDPAILIGHARALLDLSRFDETLARLEDVRKLGAPGETPEVALLYARAYEGLGRYGEADEPYRFAADRMPGLEAAARYVACMTKAGRVADARVGLEEIDRRLPRIPSHMRGEARRWRNFAASAVR